MDAKISKLKADSLENCRVGVVLQFDGDAVACQVSCVCSLGDPCMHFVS
jgi:hypothetical protein